MSHSVKIYDTCIGCTQCVRACPTDELEMIPWGKLCHHTNCFLLRSEQDPFSSYRSYLLHLVNGMLF